MAPAQIRKLDATSYHVAWICAVADLELIPALLMMDESHERPDIDNPYDDNTYRFGSMAGHNVVVATCPDAMTGQVNVRHIVGPLFRTFTAIKMTLLVGIGGGVPQKQFFSQPLKDVRLGDIVVAWPNYADDKPAVVCYDSGSALVGGFQTTSQLNRPHMILLKALPFLRTDHTLGQSNFQSYLDRLQHHKELKDRFRHPGLEHDLLFKSTYEHVGGYNSYCVDCDKANLVQRKPRAANQEDNFVFHQGRVATGNSVIQDGRKRDSISDEHGGVLCIDMEAAGVDVNSNCLVIRGISDYADSHKSDIWRSYAAGMAAVFARELLNKIPTRDVNETMDSGNKHWLVHRFMNPDFTGRREVIDKIIKRITSEDVGNKQLRFVLTGMGGQGKSEICLHVAHEVRGRFWGIFWVDVSTRTSADENFSEVADALGCPRTVDTVLETLSSLPLNREWILILDNADDTSQDYQTYLPAGNRGVILITSRNTQRATLASAGGHEKIEGLGVEDSNQLLRKVSRLSEDTQASEDEVNSLVKDLGSHTMAILQAGSHIATRYCSIADYRKALQRNRRRLIDRSRGLGLTRYDTLYATFEASTEFLGLSQTGTPEERRNDALQLLQVLSMFDYECVPLDILVDAAEGAKKARTTPAQFDMCSNELTAWHVAQVPDLVRTEKNDVRLRITDAVALLESLALVRTIKSARCWKSVSMHPLVHALASNRHSQEERRESLRMAECIVALSIFSFDAWRPYYNQFVPHLVRLIESDVGLVDEAARSRRVLQACVQIAWILHRMGLHRDMYGFTQRIFHRLGLQFQTPTKELREVYRVFALAVNREASRPAQAIPVFEAIARLDESVRDENDKDLLDNLRDLGNAYCDNAQTEQAILLLQKVVKSRQGLGEKHEDLLLTQHDLAIALSNNGQIRRSIDILRKVVENRGAVLPADDPDLLSSKQVLAVAYLRNAQVAEAVSLLEEVVRFESQTLGEDDPNAATTRACLADAYRRAGRLTEAIALYEGVTRIQTIVLGDKHPSVLRSQHRLAVAYWDAKRGSEAVALCEQAINVQAISLGRKDPFSIREQHQSAKECLKAGRVSEAFKILEKALETVNLMSELDDDSSDEAIEIHDAEGSRSSSSDQNGPRSLLSEIPTQRDTASSVPSLGLSISIAGRVVEVIRKDDELERLFNETKGRTVKDKFERNFRRLFRVFLRDLTTEFTDFESPVHNIVIRRVRKERRNIASAMAEHLFGGEASGERLKIPENEPVNKDALVHEFILTTRRAGEDSKTDTSHNRDKLGDDESESSDDEVDIDNADEYQEERQNAEQQLSHLESLFLDSEALRQFRIGYKRFLFPDRSSNEFHAARIPLAEILQTQVYLDLIALWPLPTSFQGNQTHQVFMVGWTSFVAQVRRRASRLTEYLTALPSWTKQTSYSMFGADYVLDLLTTSSPAKQTVALAMTLRKLTRPSLKAGYERIEWTCECGDRLFQDYPQCDQSNIDHAKSFVALHGNNAVTTPSSSPSAHITSPVASGGAASMQAVPNVPFQPSSSGHAAVTRGEYSHHRSGQPGQERRMFLELCVNTGRYEISLGEISFRKNQEAEFFANVRARYNHLRGFRRHFFLLTVKHVQYVRFNLRGCIRVGVLDSPLALPSDEEIAEYKYGPSPMARPIPVPENDFLHRFHKDDPRHHTFRLSDLPHKLDDSIIGNRDPTLIQRGWGVHLVEGTDIFNVGCVTVVAALLSFFVAFTWWGVTHDAQTAFTVAGFMVATQGMILGGTVMVLEHL